MTILIIDNRENPVIPRFSEESCLFFTMLLILIYFQYINLFFRYVLFLYLTEKMPDEKSSQPPFAYSDYFVRKTE